MEQTFPSVYASLTEIIEKNQRHLFCQMLDLLANTLKTFELNKTDNSFDEFFEVCVLKVTPLVFDKDVFIQNSALAALDEIVKFVDWKQFHARYSAEIIKKKLLHDFVPKIHNLRENDNRNWHKIWCLLIQVLEPDLLRGVNTLNTFLSVVESALRGGCQLAFAESFHCWRLLIQIFHRNDELNHLPRVKLICAPFRSGQLKSSYSSSVKLKVWWYYISCLGINLQANFDAVVNPFLSFICNCLQKYESLTELCVLCLSILLAKSTSDVLERLQNTFGLDTMHIEFSLTDELVLKQHWRSISNTVSIAVGTLAFSKPTLTERENLLLHFLLEPVFKAILNVMIAPLFMRISNDLQTILPKFPRLAVAFLNTIAADNLQIKQFDDEKTHSECLYALTSLLISISGTTTKAVFKNCILQVYNLKNSFISEHDVWQTMQVILDCLPLNRDLDDAKVLIWRRVSFVIMDRLHKCTYDTSMEKRLLHRWIHWPLRSYAAIEDTQIISDSIFDASFFSVWEQLLKINDIQCGELDVLGDINKSLRTLIVTRCADNYLRSFLDIYAETVMGFKIAQSAVAYKELLELITDSLKSTMLPKKSQKVFLDVFKNIVGKLNGFELKELYEQIKNVLEAAKRVTDVELAYFRHLKNIFAQNFQNDSYCNLALVMETMCTDHINATNLALSREILKTNSLELPSTPPKTMPIRRDSLSGIVKIKASSTSKTNNQMLFRPRLRSIDVSEVARKSNKNKFDAAKMFNRSAIFQRKTVNEKRNLPPLQKPTEETVTIDLTNDNTESQTTNSSPPKRIAVHLECASPSNSNADNVNNRVGIAGMVTAIRQRKQLMTGRGAQFINMIRSRQNITAQQPAANVINSNSVSNSQDAAEISSSTVSTAVVPAPAMVPSPSILKRKNSVSAEAETPLSKRKRVSFHDPPVSLTKEYIVESQYDSTSDITEAAVATTSTVSTITSPSCGSSSRAAMTNKDESSTDFVIKSPLHQLRARTISLDTKPFVVTNKTSKTASTVETDEQIFDRVLERYVSGNQQPSNTLVYKLSKIVSNVMTKEDKLKSNIMELLCETHPKEFLEHAIQENHSSMVLERLNLSSILDFISSKTKCDTLFQRNLLAKLSEILQQNETEYASLDFVKQLLQAAKYSDDVYFDLMSFLLKLRNGNKCHFNATEPLADSSSNL